MDLQNIIYCILYYNKLICKSFRGNIQHMQHYSLEWRSIARRRLMPKIFRKLSRAIIRTIFFLFLVNFFIKQIKCWMFSCNINYISPQREAGAIYCSSGENFINVALNLSQNLYIIWWCTLMIIYRVHDIFRLQALMCCAHDILMYAQNDKSCARHNASCTRYNLSQFSSKRYICVS